MFHTKFKKDGSYFFRSIKGQGNVEYNPNTKRFYFGLKTIEDLCGSGITLYIGWEEKIKEKDFIH